MDDLTYTVGAYIRDTIRADSTILSLLGITSGDAKNKIFFMKPLEEDKKFSNPRIVIYPRPSSTDELAYTGLYKGEEQFLLSLWTDADALDVNMKVLDRITTLFNKTNYTNISTLAIPLGEFQTSGKSSRDDPDKLKTHQGELLITLVIGGI